MLGRYETLLLFSPDLNQEETNALVEKFTGILEQNGGKIVKKDDWGLKTLAYPVQKQTRGRYIRLEYTLPPHQVQEFERRIRITDEVFKFITVKLSDETEQEQEEA